MSLLTAPPHTLTQAAACIGSRHGYLIERDLVHLHADVIVYDVAQAAQKNWALQLWACREAYTGGVLRGKKIADARLIPLETISASPATLHATAALLPPADGGSHAIVMTLSALASADGEEEIHSYITFPARETFLVPRLKGKISYDLNGDRVYIETESIENPRDASNASGTLTLELWALPEPYNGEEFHGAPLAGAILGSLAGQSEWNPPPFDLSFKRPPEGRWFFVLMLREWTGTGYSTRDYTTFAEPLVFRGTPAFQDVAQIPVSPVTSSSSTSAVTASTAPAVEAVEDKAISLNSASVEGLAKIKHLSRAIARAIVAARPYQSIDELLRVKGIGPKLLEKIRSSVRV